MLLFSCHFVIDCRCGTHELYKLLHNVLTQLSVVTLLWQWRLLFLKIGAFIGTLNSTILYAIWVCRVNPWTHSPIGTLPSFQASSQETLLNFSFNTYQYSFYMSCVMCFMLVVLGST